MGSIFLGESWADNVSRCHCSAITGPWWLRTGLNERCQCNCFLIRLWRKFSLKHRWYCVRLCSCWGLGKWYRVEDSMRSSIALCESTYKLCLISVGIRVLILVPLWQNKYIVFTMSIRGIVFLQCVVYLLTVCSLTENDSGEISKG